MKKIVFIFFVCILFVKVNDQNQIKGNILDANNALLIGVSVFIPELNKGTITDQTGHYLLTDVPTGKISLQYSYIGYNTEIKTIVVTQPVNIVDAVLTEAIIQS